jgi:hypothetical protein
MQRFSGLMLASLLSVQPFTARAHEFLTADQDAWPSSILVVRSPDPNTSVLWQRTLPTTDRFVPKIQSLTRLQDGTTVFCSGLDRSVFAMRPGGEVELHYGGSLVRQVRTDTNGDLYWSGLETPIDNNPLPSGFIHRKRMGTGDAETVLTFSQGDVGNDWWGAFDVRAGEIYVATLQAPSRIYRIERSIPQLVATLPISIRSFRFDSDQSIMATSSEGQICRFDDLRGNPNRYEVIARRPFKMVDFVSLP